MFLTSEHVYELIFLSRDTLKLTTLNFQSGKPVAQTQMQISHVPRSETLKLAGALQKFCKVNSHLITDDDKRQLSPFARRALDTIMQMSWTSRGFPKTEISRLHRSLQALLTELSPRIIRTEQKRLWTVNKPKQSFRPPDGSSSLYNLHTVGSTPFTPATAPPLASETHNLSPQQLTLIDFRTCTHLQNLLPLITRSVLSPTETLAPLPKTTPRLLRLTPSGNNTVVLENVRTHKIAVRQVCLEPNVHGTAESMSTTEIMDLATHLVLNAEAHNSVPAFEPYRSLLSDLLFCREKSLLLEPNLYVSDSEPNTDVRMVAAVVQAFLADWFESPK